MFLATLQATDEAGVNKAFFESDLYTKTFELSRVIRLIGTFMRSWPLRSRSSLVLDQLRFAMAAPGVGAQGHMAVEDMKSIFGVMRQPRSDELVVVSSPQQVEMYNGGPISGSGPEIASAADLFVSLLGQDAFLGADPNQRTGDTCTWVPISRDMALPVQGWANYALQMLDSRFAWAKSLTLRVGSRVIMFIVLFALFSC